MPSILRNSLPLERHGTLWCHYFMQRMLVGTLNLLLVVAGLGGTKQERPIRVVSLHYPCVALKARIQGVARLRCEIGNDGLCASVKPIAGHPLLLEDAMDNLKNWRYSPGTSSAQ